MQYDNTLHYGIPTPAHEYTLLASAVRTTAQAQTGATPFPRNFSARGIKVILDITVNAGTSATLTVTISGVDPASGKKYTLLASAGITAVGTTVYTVYPGLTAVNNVTATNVLPGTYAVDVAVGSADPATYSVGVQLLA